MLHQIRANPGLLRQRVDEALDRIPKVFAQGAADARISAATGRMLETDGREAEA